MSENRGTEREWRGLPEEEQIRRLLAEAGRRPAPPEEDLAAITETARTEWRRRYGDRGEPAGTESPRRDGGRIGGAAPAQPSAASPRRRRRREAIWWSIAASILAVALAVDTFWEPSDPAPVEVPAVATVELARVPVSWGTYRLPRPRSVPPEAGVRVGSELRTWSGADDSGRLALRMAGGASVRADGGSTIRLVSPTLVELRRGAVYVDSGGATGRSDDVAVRTAAGLFRAVGTQFEVRTGDDGSTTRLRVREGSVRLLRGAEPVVAEAGEELIVRADGAVDLGRVSLYGPDWEWVLALAPMIDIEGLPVRDFLEWIARETGLRIEFADAEAANLADTVTLHGSIAHLTPIESLGPVLSSAGLAHRVGGGSLVILAGENDR